MRYPTPYAAVNTLVDRLLTDTALVLGDQFAGFYLHGSLALGDFDPERSDIDFLVLTDGAIPGERVQALGAMHAQVAASDLPWRSNYEGSYIPLRSIRRYDLVDAVYPAIRCDGSFGLDRHGPDWVIQRHVIRQYGIALAGPAPDRLIDPVTAEELRRATAAVLHEWWAPILTNPQKLRSAEYQAYAVLTMCRALYTLQCGEVVTKPVAARWAQQTQSPRWTGLIDRALAWRHGLKLDSRDEVLALITSVIERV